MGYLAKQRDASFFRVFFNPYHYGVLTFISRKNLLFPAFFGFCIRDGRNSLLPKSKPKFFTSCDQKS